VTARGVPSRVPRDRLPAGRARSLHDCGPAWTPDLRNRDHAQRSMRSTRSGIRSPERGGEVIRPTVTSGEGAWRRIRWSRGGHGIDPGHAHAGDPAPDRCERRGALGDVRTRRGEPGRRGHLTLAPDSLSLAPTVSSLVTLTVRDPQGNPIAGTGHIYLGGRVPRAPCSRTEHLWRARIPEWRHQRIGQARRPDRAPSTAPAVDSIFASGGSLPRWGSARPPTPAPRRRSGSPP